MDAKRAFAMRRALRVAARGCRALVIIGLLAFLVAPCFSKGEVAEPIHIRYFYVGSCDSCEPVTIQSLTDAFWAAAAPIQDKTFSLDLINSFRPDGFDALVEAFDQRGIPKTARADTAMFAGSGCLIGSDADGEALTLYPAYIAAYHVPESRQLLPIAFAGEHFYNAKEVAQGALSAVVQQGMAAYTLVPAPGKAVPLPARPIDTFELPGVFLAGLLGGLNPCGVSMFLFFLSLIAVSGRRMLTLGLSYHAGKCIAYLLLGNAGYVLLTGPGSVWIKLLGAVLFMGFAVYMIHRPL